MPDPTRRQVLAAGLASAAALALPETADATARAAAPARMPAIFLPHGGGPWPFVDVGFGARAEIDALATYLRSVSKVAKTAPKAILVVSAHWEQPNPTLMTAAHPPMLYDYYGFPPASYHITWPAPGDPDLAVRVRALLEGAGFATAADAQRGFDHGTFVPLKLAWPNADVPTLQLSLKQGLDPAEHLAMGRALAPLRDQGVLIIGSGMTYHNLRQFGPQGQPVAAAFDAWLVEAMAQDPAERDRRLVQWSSAPAARAAHPREEHLLPLMVIAGTAAHERATLAYNGTLVGLKLSAFHFG